MSVQTKTLLYPDNDGYDPCADPALAEHQQAPVQVGCRAPVYVDAGLTELLKLLWSRGINTLYSCEGFSRQRPAYLLFADGHSADLFRHAINPGHEIAGYASGQTLEKYLPRGKKRRSWKTHRDCWEWMAGTLLVEERDEYVHTPRLDMRISVYFPPKHIPLIIEALRQ